MWPMRRASAACKLVPKRAKVHSPLRPDPVFSLAAPVPPIAPGAVFIFAMLHGVVFRRSFCPTPLLESVHSRAGHPSSPSGVGARLSLIRVPGQAPFFLCERPGVPDRPEQGYAFPR